MFSAFAPPPDFLLTADWQEVRILWYPGWHCDCNLGARELVWQIMSAVPPMLEGGTLDISPDTPSTSSQLLKRQRVLACVLCQQRKVKCDRKFPCSNCIKSRAQCVPATLAQRRRRRRFPERELLERIRKYEDLLRQNSVPFEPLHKDSATEKMSLDAESGSDSDNEPPETVGLNLPTVSTTGKSKREFETKYVLFRELVQAC